jgi:hypothetical protein
MLLKLNEEKIPMKIVFLLSEELKNDPERVGMSTLFSTKKIRS